VRIVGENFGPVAVGLVVTYGDDADEYVAANCRIAEPHRVITCNSVPGIGRGHAWWLTIDGQETLNVFPELDARADFGYAPPVLLSYSGDGVNSQTPGNDSVVLHGLNFGPAGVEWLDLVGYGPQGVLEYEVTDRCVVTSHTIIECTTDAGAGAQMQWTITIDGQQNVAPSVSYHPPVVSSVHGAGGANAEALPTVGGVQVRIVGTNMGPPAGESPESRGWARFSSDTRRRMDEGSSALVAGVGTEYQHMEYPVFLGEVTYGPSGREYSADCVVEDHDSLLCDIGPGTGSTLRWVVTVSGQESEVSAPLGSYAEPVIVGMDPATAPTSGGVLGTVYGTNFGIDDPNANVTLLWEEYRVIPTFNPRVAEYDGVPVHAVDFIVPDGCGDASPVAVVVTANYATGTTSVARSAFNATTFQYGAPEITYGSQAPGVTPGAVLVTLVGNNLCGPRYMGDMVAHADGQGDGVITQVSDQQLIVRFPSAGADQNEFNIEFTLDPEGLGSPRKASISIRNFIIGFRTGEGECPVSLPTAGGAAHQFEMEFTRITPESDMLSVVMGPELSDNCTAQLAGVAAAVPPEMTAAYNSVSRSCEVTNLEQLTTGETSNFRITCTSPVGQGKDAPMLASLNVDGGIRAQGTLCFDAPNVTAWTFPDGRCTWRAV
jgi:hypothetical protein